MQAYQSKQELLDAIQKSYQLLDQEFNGVEESQMHLRIPDVERTPYEMIAYQIGWLNLVMSWDRDELAGKEVITPTPEYKWNQLGPLYQSYYEQYRTDSLTELRNEFRSTVDVFCGWIEGLSERELFDPSIRNWATTSAKWPVWKWIHINSTAPFQTFRAKIRKWKRVLLKHSNREEML